MNAQFASKERHAFAGRVCPLLRAALQTARSRSSEPAVMSNADGVGGHSAYLARRRERVWRPRRPFLACSSFLALRKPRSHCGFAKGSHLLPLRLELTPLHLAREPRDARPVNNRSVLAETARAKERVKDAGERGNEGERGMVRRAHTSV